MKTVFVIFCVLIGQAFSQGLLDKELSAYKKTERKALTLHALELEELAPKYSKLIGDFGASAKKAGNLDGYLEAKNEKERVAKGLSPASRLSRVEGIADRQEWLNKRIAMREAVRDKKILVAQTELLERLSKLEVDLTRAGKIDEAQATRAKVMELKNGPRFAHRPRYTSPGKTASWTVLLRGQKLAGLYDSETNDESGYAIPLEKIPDDVRFLRIANIQAGEAVIRPVKRSEYSGNSSRRMGTIYFIASEGCFGFCNSQDRVENSSGYIMYSGYKGWGIGRARSDYSTARTSVWNGEVIKTPLEFAFTSDDLGPEEKKLLLAEETKPSTTRGSSSISSFSSRRPPLPQTPGAHTVPTKMAAFLEGASSSGTTINLPRNSLVEWKMSTVPSGRYSVIVYGYGSSRIHAQGVRDTSANRGRVIVEERNAVGRSISYSDNKPVNMGAIQLGGPVKLQLISRSGTFRLERVEILRAK